MAKEQRRSVLSKEECFKVPFTYNFTRESFKAALTYLHGLKLIFYVLPNIVFIDAQALLDKITELVVHSLSLQAKPENQLLGTPKKFVKCGIVTPEILEQFNSHYALKFFTKEYLILLFKHLKIMAEVGEGEYLVPCLLKTEDVSRAFPDTLFQTVSPLLFYFHEGGPKLGVYCFLIASLITDFRWKLLSENHCPVQVSRNSVKFELAGGNPGCITTSDSFSTFFHVTIEAPEGANCETILTGIQKASQKLNYRNSIPGIAFPCLKHEDLHPATISSIGLLTCTNDSCKNCINHDLCITINMVKLVYCQIILFLHVHQAYNGSCSARCVYPTIGDLRALVTTVHVGFGFPLFNQSLTMADIQSSGF